MKPRGPVFAGLAMGILAGLFLISRAPRSADSPTGPMLPEHGGAIRSVVMQYTAGSQFVIPVYREFLRQQPSDLTVYLACPEQADIDELLPAIQPLPCKIVPVFTHHPMTAWSRDRWVPLRPAAGNQPITLFAQPAERDQLIWPLRAGDSLLPDDLARALSLHASRSTLSFDGGDLLADDHRVFATRAVLERNRLLADADGISNMLARDLHRPVTLLADGPDHHAAMFMMALQSNRMLVADPSLAQPLFNADAPTADALDAGPAFDPQTQQRFDSVAAVAAQAGYTVTRIPVVPAARGKNYITYVNVILDCRNGHEIVYMPTFAGQDRLNAAATAVWKSLGFEVRPIDCTTVFDRGGTLHCLVNVLDRTRS